MVRPCDGRPELELPPGYVTADVQLGYASTVHAAQGVTVDSAHLVTDGKLDAPALYVAMSRGAIRNTAHVAVAPDPADLPEAPGRAGGETRVGGESPRASALAVLESCLERGDEALAATVTAERDAERRGSVAALAGRFENEVRLACRERLEAHLDELTAEGVLDPWTRARFGADQGTGHLSRLLRAVEQAGADPRETLREAIAGPRANGRGLADAQSVAQVLSFRISGDRPLPHPVPGTAIPAGISREADRLLRELDTAIRERQAELGAAAAEEAPEWAVLSLGPVPPAEDATDRADWERRAGAVAAYREAAGWDAPDRPLGRMPGVASTERRALFATAHEALGRPEASLDEAAMSDGQLLARVRAWQREQAWAPPHADDALRAAELAAEQAARTPRWPGPRVGSTTRCRWTPRPRSRSRPSAGSRRWSTPEPSGPHGSR